MGIGFLGGVSISQAEDIADNRVTNYDQNTIEPLIEDVISNAGITLDISQGANTVDFANNMTYIQDQQELGYWRVDNATGDVLSLSIDQDILNIFTNPYVRIATWTDSNSSAVLKTDASGTVGDVPKPTSDGQGDYYNTLTAPITTTPGNITFEVTATGATTYVMRIMASMEIIDIKDNDYSP